LIPTYSVYIAKQNKLRKTINIKKKKNYEKISSEKKNHILSITQLYIPRELKDESRKRFSRFTVFVSKFDICEFIV